MVILLALSPHFPYQLDVGHRCPWRLPSSPARRPAAAYRFIPPVTAQGRLNWFCAP
jgi:hypothetical protein